MSNQRVLVPARGHLGGCVWLFLFGPDPGILRSSSGNHLFLVHRKHSRNSCPESNCTDDGFDNIQANTGDARAWETISYAPPIDEQAYLSILMLVQVLKYYHSGMQVRR